MLTQLLKIDILVIFLATFKYKDKKCIWRQNSNELFLVIFQTLCCT